MLNEFAATSWKVSVELSENNTTPSFKASAVLPNNIQLLTSVIILFRAPKIILLTGFKLESSGSDIFISLLYPATIALNSPLLI